MQPLKHNGTPMKDSLADLGEPMVGGRLVASVSRKVRRVSGSIWGSKVARGVMLAGLTGFAIAGGGMAVSGTPSGLVDKAAGTMLPGFAPAKLVLQGNNAVTHESVEQVLARQGTNSLFALDAADYRERLLANPWIVSAEISKVYPDTVVVDIVERQPFAFWKSDNRVHVIARDGTVLGDASPEHMRLPQVVGSAANVAASEFIAVISRFPELAGRSSAFVRVAQRRWNLVTRDNITVMLPEEGWREALVELDRLHKTNALLDRELVQIDLRLPDRLVVRLDEQDATERREFLDTLLKRAWHKT